jgi:hypothetical protein
MRDRGATSDAELAALATVDRRHRARPHRFDVGDRFLPDASHSGHRETYRRPVSAERAIVRRVSRGTDET